MKHNEWVRQNYEALSPAELAAFEGILLKLVAYGYELAGRPGAHKDILLPQIKGYEATLELVRDLRTSKEAIKP